MMLRDSWNMRNFAAVRPGHTGSRQVLRPGPPEREQPPSRLRHRERLLLWSTWYSVYEQFGQIYQFLYQRFPGMPPAGGDIL